VEFAPELAVDLDAMTLSETGLYVQVLEEGDGPQAVPGDQLGVHYTVWLSDGSKLDSSFDKTPPAPYDLILGRTPLIAGWNEGVTGMRLGEKRRLVVPYQLGYRAEGRPPAIPGYSTLVFEVELAAHEPAAAE
jgi:FKBP-type peptidyl-prolyl cis-trans isomerase